MPSNEILSAVSVFCTNDDWIYQELSTIQITAIQFTNDSINLTAKTLLEKHNLKQSVDIIIGNPKCPIDISIKENIKNYNLFFEINEINKPIAHEHLHFLRFITVIKPKCFAMSSPVNYFKTTESEFLEEFFRIIGYKITTLTLNDNPSKLGIIIGDRVDFIPMYTNNNCLNEFNYQHYMKSIIDHISKNMKT